MYPRLREVRPPHNITRVWMLFTVHAQGGYDAGSQISVPDVQMAHFAYKALLIIESPSHYILVLPQNQLSSARNYPMNGSIASKFAVTIYE